MTLDFLVRATIYLFFFLFPIFYLPVTSEAYEYNKMALLIVTVIILFILACFKIIKEHRFSIVKTTFGFPLILLAGTYLISTLIQSPNITVTLTTPLSTATIIAGVVFYFFLINITHKSPKPLKLPPTDNLMLILIFDALLISLYTILLTTGIIPKSAFTPVGSLLATAMFLSTIAIYLLSSLLQQVYSSFTRHALLKLDLSFIPSTSGRTVWYIPSLRTSFYLLSSIFITGTTIFLSIKFNTGEKPILLPFSFGWTIFVEILKSVKTLLLGVGPSNFITAFTLAKPETVNNTPVWNMIFTSSSSFLLTLATEAGIIAGSLFILIFLKSLKLLKSLTHHSQLTTHNSPLTTYNLQPTTLNQPFILSLIFALTIQAILPSSMALFILTFILLAFSSDKETMSAIDLSRLGKFIYMFPVLLIFSSVFLFYIIGRIYLSEMHFKGSLDALVNNQVDKAYQLQQQAITLNPYLDRYHLAFSKTSLMIANALAGKENLSDEDKQNIPMLVKQAIDQAKIAVVLYQTNVVNWDNLGGTYASLINFAAGADEFAIRSYQQKIILDGANPNSYLTLGGLYLRLKKYQEAEDSFRKAINLKPDLANAHYNLAISLREQQKYQEAYIQLQTTLAFLDPQSENAKKVEEELSDLTKLLSREGEDSTMSISPLKAPVDSVQSEVSSSALQNLPTLAPTLSLPGPPITTNPTEASSFEP